MDLPILFAKIVLFGRVHSTGLFYPRQAARFAANGVNRKFPRLILCFSGVRPLFALRVCPPDPGGEPRTGLFESGLNPVESVRYGFAPRLQGALPDGRSVQRGKSAFRRCAAVAGWLRPACDTDPHRGRWRPITR